MAGSRVGWDRWRQICGWLALVAAALWALKFTFIVAAPEYAPGDQIPPTLELLDRWYVQFVAPALGSLLGLVALSGLAEPLVRGRRWFIGLPIALVVSLLGTMALSGLVNALATRAVDSSSIAASVEPMPVLVLAGGDLDGRGAAESGVRGHPRGPLPLPDHRRPAAPPNPIGPHARGGRRSSAQPAGWRPSAPRCCSWRRSSWSPATGSRSTPRSASPAWSRRSSPSTSLPKRDVDACRPRHGRWRHWLPR